MYNSYESCFIIEFSLERHFRNPQNAFRFFSSLLNTHRYINGPLSSLKMNQTAQYVQLYYNGQVFFSKPTEEFYIIRLLAENAFKELKVENQISIYSDIYRQLVGTLTLLTDSASKTGDFLLELFYLKDAFTNKLAKYILRSPKLMKLSAKSKKFLENHTINLDAMFN